MRPVETVFPVSTVLLTSQAARCYLIERALRRNGCLAFDKLRDLVGVSPATLKRDIQYMRRTLEAPLQYDACLNGYRLVDDLGRTAEQGG
ncbi:hypothetical protein [Piscinibacter gummiphilus]|uniref:HTH domain-containing protein n=1 Tax=Piscinibacter gummiphilus TaxID=946333 RepID=A0ABZ0D7N1_9BURK|nr:hypothetical protein [Piscinibacter gummiphilus]WOB11277.1 hypothetical protein RXV79_26970 [Piscinibacter gummiphilus]